MEKYTCEYAKYLESTIIFKKEFFICKKQTCPYDNTIKFMKAENQNLCKTSQLENLIQED